MASFQKLFENETSEQRKKRLKSEHQATYRKRQKTKREDTNNISKQDTICIKRHELGRMNQICIKCGAKFWIEEKQNKSKTSPLFAVCCAGGKVSLPPLLKPPQYLLDLYTSSNSDAKSF